MKIIIFLALLILVVASTFRINKTITHKELIWGSKVIFFITTFNFLSLLGYHLFNALNEINRLQFTDLTLELNQLTKGTFSVVFISLFLYIVLMGMWLKVRRMKPKHYKEKSAWLLPGLMGLWFTINTGFILLTLEVFSL